MEGLLRARLSEQTQQFKKRTATFRRRLGRFAQIFDVADADGLAILKVMTHSFDCPTCWDVSSIKRWWRKYEGELTNSSQPIRTIVGRGRQLPLIARFGQDTKEESYTIEKFSLPSRPFILVATPKAQEGIDLHRHCRRVVLYDLNWNPAVLEQRIGRVHRLGGHSKNKKVEVIGCFQRGTYSEVIMERAQHRLKMMHVLLGAGTWLEADEEVHDLDRYRMSFLP